MIVYGGGSVVRSGLLDKVKKYLDEAGIAHVELGGIQPNPTDPKVYEGIELGRREKLISCFRWVVFSHRYSQSHCNGYSL